MAGGYYRSFGGVDIVAQAGNKEITLQAISYSITREKVPIYVMGKANPISFSRNKRAAAGTLIVPYIDQYSFLQQLVGDDGKNPVDVGTTLGQSGLPSASATVDQATLSADEKTPGGKPKYADQVLPFDITLNAENEYGARARMVVKGVELLNEGSGTSIDDSNIEQQFTYVCIEIEPWQPTTTQTP